MKKIEQMGLDLYNALRGPLSQMESADEMDNFKIELGNDKQVIAECMKCAETNIGSAETMKKAGVHMNFAMIDYYNNLIIEACKNAMNKEENKMADKNMVKIEQITVDGIVYTSTRPGYYYKKVDGKQTRIPKAEWEQVFEKWQAEVEADRKAREEKQDQSDKEAEDAVNGKKKVKKTRRSKDVMYTHTNGLTLTTKQAEFIMHIPDTCFYEHGLESTVWCDVLADEIGGQFAGKPMTVGAMISTLREKHLIYVETEKVNGKKAKYFGFTDLGKEVAKGLGLE